MSNATIDFKRGELVAAARAYLKLYLGAVSAIKRNNDQEAQFFGDAADDQEQELARLIWNEFQFHGNPIGDVVQLSLIILLMNGEEHSASARHSS